jgi:hypothetical protein
MTKVKTVRRNPNAQLWKERENNLLVRLNKTREKYPGQGLLGIGRKTKTKKFEFFKKFPNFREHKFHYDTHTHVCNLSFAPNLHLLFFYFIINSTKE